MAMNAVDIAMAAQEFSDDLAGATLLAAAETSFYAVVLQFETADGRRLKLLLSANDQFSRAHLLARDIKPPKPPLPFGATLEKRLAGSRVEKIDVKRGDRIVKIYFFTGQIIAAELTGAHANIFLVESDGKISASLRRNRSNKRNLSVGAAYEETFDAPDRNVENVPTVPSRAAAKHSFFNFAAEEYYGALEASFESERLVKGLTAAIEEKIKKAKRAKESALCDLEDKKRLRETRRRADALAAGLYSVKRGSSEARLFDLETGDPVLIKLDPSVSPQENLTRLYAKAAKGDRGVEIIQRRLTEIEERKTVWEKRRSEFIDRVKSFSLDEIIKWVAENNLAEESLSVLRRGERAAVSAGIRAKEKKATLFREFVSATGVRLLVGRNDKVNDKLTFGTLKKDDFWFHAAGTAGPHVAAPMREKNKTLDDETLLDACTLAAKFAGFKTGDEVEIIYARRKELNKPGKRAKPGAVVVAKPKYKTVVVEEERLRRLLKKDE